MTPDIGERQRQTDAARSAKSASPAGWRVRPATAALTDKTSLLAEWGLPADTRLAAAEHGTNNQTVIVSAGSRRFVLRISQNLTSAQVRAEHRLLARLRGAGLPFSVPEPQATLTGEYLVETGGGPATLTAWLPGVRPGLSGEAALLHLGRTVGLLSRALAPVPPQDAPHNWSSAVHVHPDVPDVSDLCGDLRAAGADPELTRLLETLASEAEASPVTGLPVQVVHGDLAASNLLADERTGEITAVLDFEIAGLDTRIHDLMSALKQCGALDGQGWREQVAAMATGYTAAQEMTGAEAAAVPDLLSEGLVASVLWRAGRWRRGQAQLAEVTDRLRTLERTSAWLATYGGELADLLAGLRAGESA